MALFNQEFSLEKEVGRLEPQLNQSIQTISISNALFDTWPFESLDVYLDQF